MEVEAKFLIENLIEIESYLNNFCIPKNLEILDIYFDDEHFNLLKNHQCAFRIRKENDRFYITIKRKLEDRNNLFRRFELEKEIDLNVFNSFKSSKFYFCFDNIEIVIFPRIEIFSRRKLYQIDNLKVCLDKVFFNENLIMNFLEVEGDEAEILGFVNKLKSIFNLSEFKVSKLEVAIFH